MDVKTYRARTMYEALHLVRQELGPDAAVLRTREVGTGMLGWLRGGRRIEVMASGKISVPSRLQRTTATPPMPHESINQITAQPIAERRAAKLDAGLDLEAEGQTRTKQSSAHQNHSAPARPRRSASACIDFPDSLLRIYADLIEAEFHEEVARGLVETLLEEAPKSELAQYGQLRLRLARIIEAEIAVAGEIDVSGANRRVVALVGPTGVGKTTTVA